MSTQSKLSKPRFPQPVDLPKSSIYPSKQLFLYNRIKCRLRSLKYHYDHVSPDSYDTDLYFKHTSILSKALYLLDTTNFICNKAYAKAYFIFKFIPDSSDEHCKLLFGKVLPRFSKVDYDLKDAFKVLNYSKRCNKNVFSAQELFDIAYARKQIYDKLKTKLRQDNINQRKSILKKRVKYAIAQAHHEGWFMVFATLTVDDFNLHSVFNDKNSTAWTDYIRSVDRAVGINLHGDWRTALSYRRKGLDFHKYFAVVEYGTKTGRPHIHCIHMMKTLPEHSRDPNFGCIFPKNYNIDSFRKFWPHGICSTWIPMRYSMSDAFSKERWVWPLDRSTDFKKPLPQGGHLRVANYICKYINKTYNETHERSEIKWRTKMTRKLGLQVLEMVLDNLSPKILYRIIRNPEIKLQLLNQRVPSSLLRRIALRKYLLNPKLSMRNSMRRNSVLKILESKVNILKSFSDSIPKTTEFNQQNSGVIRIKKYQNTVESNDYLQQVLDFCSSVLFGNNPCFGSNQIYGFTGQSY